MDIQKYAQKSLVFMINLFVVFLVVCGLKEANKDRYSVESKESETAVPVADDVAQLQSEMATDRENKLRDLNNKPKTLVQNDEVKTTTTVQPQKETSSSSTTVKKAPSKKTKTS